MSEDCDRPRDLQEAGMEAMSMIVAIRIVTIKEGP